jgi:hypothetical protein
MRSWELTEITQTEPLPRLVAAALSKDEELQDFMCFMQYHRTSTTHVARKPAALRKVLASSEYRTVWYAKRSVSLLLYAVSYIECIRWQSIADRLYPRRSGFLLQKIGSDWQRRWFALTPQYLCIYDSLAVCARATR